MRVRNVEELDAFNLAVAFKREAYRLTKASRPAFMDLKFKGQLYDAASSVESNIAEGFCRFRPAECAQFLSYALASLKEAVVRLRDGVDREYFVTTDCNQAFQLAERCRRTTLAFQRSQYRLMDDPNPPFRRSAARPKNPRRR
jgi:four helix bundle protein